MKKILIIAGLVVVATMAYAASAYANAGPHGGYGNFTDACAGCHRAHTATQSYLLKSGSTVYEFCLTCHDGATNSVRTNVKEGVLMDGLGASTGNRLNGGGFYTIGGGTNYVSSIHRVEGAPNVGGAAGTIGSGNQTAYGSGSSGQGIQGVLECTSCHSPHGSANYRVLKDDSWNSGHGVTKWVDDIGILAYSDDTVTPDGTPENVLAGYKYTALQSKSDYDKQQLNDYSRYAENTPSLTITDGSGNPTGFYPIKAGYTEGMVRFCATCHRQYWTMSGAWNTPSDTSPSDVYNGTQDVGDGLGSIARYRHTTSRYFTSGTYGRITSNPLRMAVGAWYDSTPPTKVSGVGGVGYGSTCLMCHFAHGTTAQQSGFAATNTGPSGDSALLYHPNRGTCRSCHMQTN